MDMNTSLMAARSRRSKEEAYISLHRLYANQDVESEITRNPLARIKAITLITPLKYWLLTRKEDI